MVSIKSATPSGSMNRVIVNLDEQYQCEICMRVSSTRVCYQCQQALNGDDEY